MVEVFREVKRVLRSDGTVWLNLGDSYSGYHGNSRVPDDEAPSNKPGYIENMRASTVGVSGLKSKDLVGVPWRLAFALQADGWYLRSEIIWSKPNPMPESVTDRPTKSHEQVFLLTKSARYFYDAEAVREGVYDVPESASADGVPRTTQSTGRVLTVPTLFSGEDDGVADAAGSGREGPRGATTLAAVAPGQGNEGQARSLTTQAGATSRISPHGTGPSGGPEGSGISGGEGASSAVLRLETDVGDGTIDADSDGVGGDSDGAGPAVSVLRGGPAADDGSRHPVEQGWDAYQGERGGGVQALQQSEGRPVAGRNLRTVWTIATQPWKGAHFATFPQKLVEPCIKAGTSERGVCPECGAPWVREVERGAPEKSGGGNTQGHADGPMDRNGHGQWDAGAIVTMRVASTTGWRPSCAHVAEPVPSVVLDCFAGSGTTGLVANRLGRRAVLIDLSADYIDQAMLRNAQRPLGLLG
jgi:hypothetical protein